MKSGGTRVPTSTRGVHHREAHRPATAPSAPVGEPSTLRAVTAPRWGGYNPETGEFDIENKGVAPDIEVDLDPASWRKGRDPQLEKGVEVALKELQEHPVPPIKRPKYPIYNWAKVRADAAHGQTATASGAGSNSGSSQNH